MEYSPRYIQVWLQFGYTVATMYYNVEINIEIYFHFSYVSLWLISSSNVLGSGSVYY